VSLSRTLLFPTRNFRATFPEYGLSREVRRAFSLLGAVFTSAIHSFINGSTALYWALASFFSFVSKVLKY
jgi:hypothetical protein